MSRRRPCRHCPWKVGADPNRIPGFSMEKAKTDLAASCPDETSLFGTPLMACHESSKGADWVCIGWATSEASRDSIPLRLAMADGLVPGWPELDAARRDAGIVLHESYPEMIAGLVENYQQEPTNGNEKP